MPAGELKRSAAEAPLKTQVFVLVPYDVSPAEIGDFERLLLERHRFEPDEPSSRGRYDYLVGALKKSLNDPVAEGRCRQRYAAPTPGTSASARICRRTLFRPLWLLRMARGTT